MKHGGGYVMVVITEILRFLCTKFYVTIGSLGVMTNLQCKKFARVKQFNTQ